MGTLWCRSQRSAQLGVRQNLAWVPVSLWAFSSAFSSAEDSGHRLGKARPDSVSKSKELCPFTAISAELGQHLAHSRRFKG